MCEKTESKIEIETENKKACLKIELEEAKTTFKKSMQENNSKLCDMFNDLFKKYEYETNK